MNELEEKLNINDDINKNPQFSIEEKIAENKKYLKFLFKKEK